MFVANDVDHLVDGVVFISKFCGSYVLGHVDAGAVAAQEQFLVEAFGAEVGPYRAVGAAVEYAFVEPFHHFLLAFEVGF